MEKSGKIESIVQFDNSTPEQEYLPNIEEVLRDGSQDTAIPNSSVLLDGQNAWIPPNGGGTAWLQVAAGYFMSMNSWGLINNFGVYQTYYHSTLLPHTTNSAISWIGSTQGFLLSVATVFAGFACDAGHARLTLGLGSVLVVLGLVFTSLGTEYWHLLLAQGFCIGLGSGCCFMTSVSVLPTYFSTRRALAIGLSGAGSSVGGVVYPILFHNLQPRIGSGWATRLIALIALCTLSFSFIAIRPRAKAKHASGATALKKLSDPSTFTDPAFTLFSLAAFLSFVGLFIPFFYVEQYALTQAHLSFTLSFYSLPLLSVGSLFGRVAPALLVNRLGALTVLAGCTFVSSVLAFAWLGIGGNDSNSAASIVLFTLLYGFFSGAFVSLRTVVVVAITPKEKVENLGARLGVNAFCAALGLLIGNPIAGLLMRQENGWIKLKLFCAGTVLLGSVFTFITAVMAKRKKVGG